MTAQNNVNPSRPNVQGPDGSPPMATGGDRDALKATEFANIAALLASVPNVDGNPFALWGVDDLMAQGASQINGLAEVLLPVGNDAADIEGYRGRGMVAKDSMAKGAEIACGRLITSLAGNYAYTHALMCQSEERLQGHYTKVQNTDSSASRETIWGLVSATERGEVYAQTAAAQAYRLCGVIQGMVDAYETLFGNFALPARRSEVRSLDAGDKLAALKARMAARAAA